jgi:hypothetical protein
LDNCVNHRVSKLIQGHEVVHARELGWAELTNGHLLDAAESAGFTVLLTVDQNLRHQQRLEGRSINLLTVLSPSITLSAMTSMLDVLTVAIQDLELADASGQSVVVRYSDKRRSDETN